MTPWRPEKPQLRSVEVYLILIEYLEVFKIQSIVYQGWQVKVPCKALLASGLLLVLPLSARVQGFRCSALLAAATGCWFGGLSNCAWGCG